MFFFYICILNMVLITKMLCFIYNQVSCSGLLSLALLEGLSATQLLERYLALRSQALQAILSPCQSLDNAIVKEKLSHSYTLLVHSILVIHHCFLGKSYSYKSNKIQSQIFKAARCVFKVNSVFKLGTAVTYQYKLIAYLHCWPARN